MIEITQGFTSISAGADPISPPMTTRRPTGARVTLEFCREEALVSGQPVRAHYEFGGDGGMRTATGIPTPTRVDVHPGSVAVFRYRLSHWIEPHAVMRLDIPNVRQRTDRSDNATHHAKNSDGVIG